MLFIAYSTGSLQIVERSSAAQKQTNGSNAFDKKFLFGAATAAFQIEGGWKQNGKGPSIWDKCTHDHPELIADHLNADVAADSYNLFAEDIKALKETGVS